MKTQHKHAEVLITWLQNQSTKLEFKRPLPGAEWEVIYSLINPISNPDYEWRIKQEPKPDVVFDFEVTIDETVWLNSAGANIKVTFDGETGKLKSAEVIS